MKYMKEIVIIVMKMVNNLIMTLTISKNDDNDDVNDYNNIHYNTYLK